MARSRWQYALLFLSFLALALAASPTSFCKCTCFSNSTIIPLDGAADGSKYSTPTSSSDDTRAALRSRTCNDCNKQFCLDYHLPICQGAKDEDVFTTCFQRDSRKDEAVVFIFIIATGGLLIWAAVKPWWQKWRKGREASARYAPVGSADGSGSG